MQVNSNKNNPYYDFDDAEHYIILYNEPQDLDGIHNFRDEEDTTFRDELMGYTKDEGCSSDEELKAYLRNLFYFTLRRQTISNEKVLGRDTGKFFRDYPVNKLIDFMREIGLDPLTRFEQYFKFITLSNGAKYPNRLEVKKFKSVKHVNEYRSVNWVCESMDKEADAMCNMFLDAVFPEIRKLWKRSCIVDYPYSTDWNSNCGEDFIDFMRMEVIDEGEGKFFAYCFEDQDAGHDTRNLFENISLGLEMLSGKKEK